MTEPSRSDIPPLVARRLREQFEQVHRTETVLYHWQTPEGREFWDSVHYAVQSGVDIDAIGEMLGLSSISARYRAYAAYMERNS